MKKPPNENYKIRKSVVSILEQEKTYSTSFPLLRSLFIILSYQEAINVLKWWP